MNWWQRLLRKKRLEDQLDTELRFHFDQQVSASIRQGISEEEARRRARLTFGGMDQVKEECRDARGTQWVESTLQDIRFAARTLRKNPGFAFAAICTLALGIGANAAIFGVVYSVLLKPLPYSNPDHVVTVATSIPQVRAKYPSLPVRANDFQEFQRSNSVFSGMSALRGTNFNLTGDGEPERLYGARVSANFFWLLGVQPERGRSFVPEEDQPGRDRVIVISHELWTRRFGAEPAVLNRTLLLDGQSYLVIGIMPKGFLFPRKIHPLVGFGPQIDVWKPMAFSKEELTSEGSWNYGVIARLKPDVTIGAAHQQLDAISKTIVTRVRKQVPGFNFDLTTQIVPIREVFSGNVRQGLILVLGAVGLLLLIACVNVANLLLARMSGRGREFATRAALGAPRWRLVRQLLTESVLIASLGAAGGLLIATWGTRLLVSFGPADSLAMQSAHFSTPVLLFSMIAALVTGIAFGLAPAWETARGDLHNSLKDGSRGMTSGRQAGRLRRVLVTLEVALCTGLLAVAGLLLHSFVKVMGVDKGFTVEKILSADLALSGKQYGEPQRIAFYRELATGIRALPGVAAAGAITALPLLHEADSTQVFPEADTEHSLDRPVAAYRAVTPGYFSTMGITLLAGRFFDEQEPSRAVIISQSLANKLWPGEPLSTIVGRRVRQGDPTKDRPRTVVGVVGDVRTGGLERDPFPVIYQPHPQSPAAMMTLVVRTAQEPEMLAKAIRAEVWKLDKDLPIPTMKTMREIVSDSVAQRRFQMMLIVLFALLALVLAVVGIYGVTSFAVARQTQEIGLRIALGAQEADVLRPILWQGLQPVVLGLILGLVAAGITARAIRAVLFGVGPLDPLALGTVSCILICAATLACYFPARRASSVDPVVALRFE